uniref:Secreted protein n=1 Tax=Heterorhabditis bacteriophora TaxID=37862 RepID=A0A1I7X8Q5_HETBA
MMVMGVVDGSRAVYTNMLLGPAACGRPDRYTCQSHAIILLQNRMHSKQTQRRAGYTRIRHGHVTNEGHSCLLHTSV